MWLLEYRGYGETRGLGSYTKRKEAIKAKRELGKTKPPDWIRDYIWVYEKE